MSNEEKVTKDTFSDLKQYYNFSRGTVVKFFPWLESVIKMFQKTESELSVTAGKLPPQQHMLRKALMTRRTGMGDDDDDGRAESSALIENIMSAFKDESVSHLRFLNSTLDAYVLKSRS